MFDKFEKWVVLQERVLENYLKINLVKDFQYTLSRFVLTKNR